MAILSGSCRVPIVCLCLWSTWFFVGVHSYPTVSKQGLGESTFDHLASWKDFELASFVDLNADRRTDIIMVSSKDKTIEVLIEPDAKNASKYDTKLIPRKATLITDITNVRSVVSADFDGDSRVDFLILTSDDKSGPFQAYVVYGVTLEEQKFNSAVNIGRFTRQPLVCDMNADLIADIYGEESVNDGKSKRVAYISESGKKLQRFEYPFSLNLWSSLSYSAFSAVGTDLTPSIIVLTENKKLEVFRPFPPEDIKSTKNHQITTIDFPDDLKNALNSGYVSNFVLGDFNLNNTIDLLMIACPKDDATTCAIHVYSFVTKTWSKPAVDWTPVGVIEGSGKWGMAITPERSAGLSLASLVGPSLGDSDLDGYLDLLVGLVFTATDSSKSTMGAVLRNTKSSSQPNLAFTAHLLPNFASYKDNHQISQIAFFDHNEDGTLDVFTTSSMDSSAEVALHIQNPIIDGYFIKVMLTNGRCSGASSCPGHRYPYGLPVYGLRASYVNEAGYGGMITSCATFVTSSCCSSLQLPFYVFGLGPYANYVPQITASIPTPSDEVARVGKISFVVPKSQIVMIPYPITEPSAWITTLFLEPLYNMKVIYVAITLLGTCFFLIFVISILQCLEMREDRLEKMQQAQKFHFDAM